MAKCVGRLSLVMKISGTIIMMFTMSVSGMVKHFPDHHGKIAYVIDL